LSDNIGGCYKRLLKPLMSMLISGVNLALKTELTGILVTVVKELQLLMEQGTSFQGS